MEYDSIDREIYVDASPEVVFEVITRPEHLREWWPDEATLDPVPGGVGELVFNGHGPNATALAVPLTVLEARPPQLFSFRWAHERDERPDPTNSYLVTFKLTPSGSGTTVQMTETGFRERGWELAKLEAAYQDHARGWALFLPRLAQYSAGLVTTA